MGAICTVKSLGLLHMVHQHSLSRKIILNLNVNLNLESESTFTFYLLDAFSENFSVLHFAYVERKLQVISQQNLTFTS